ncbi:GNAT family N-acetyltransferase [Dongia sp.]|uniref:GNAT family N-acetyltransferase n=1 Tax=Dongia sp. TaxID=1977262 RepID=UPI003751C5F8
MHASAPRQLTANVIDRIEAVPAADWDALSARGGAGPDNPFLRHAFLKALEDSGSVGRKTGWLPQHLILSDESGAVQAAAPMYVKGHSQGEYIFDHGWADAFERAGGQYYPKLQVAVPFTPVPGPRLLARGNDADVREALIGALRSVAEQSKLSSLHVTFCTEDEAAAMGEAGFLHRIGVQYHFNNPGYGSFDDFLGALSSRKRKSIRKEREQVREYGLTIRALSGAEITPRHWDAFFAFYMDTGGRKWGRPYLTRRFFDLIGSTMPENVVLMFAEKDGDPVAGALNLKGSDCLYGRNWGCLEEYRFLHFELCYYQAIDYAIEHQLKRVEAGAQGEHKIQRGYLPVATHSAHWIAERSFRAAVADYLERERRVIQQEIAGLAELSPFRKAEC